MNNETLTLIAPSETAAPAASPIHSTRNGKIARLPAEIRQELNQRLLDGEPVAALVDWLNALPRVQAVLQRFFGGRPVTEQNLSEWRQGGFRDWMAKTEADEELNEILAETAGARPIPDTEKADGHQKSGVETLADRVANWFFPHYVAAARGRLMAAETLEERWSILRTICDDLAGLRRNEHYLERLKLWRDKLEVETEKSEEITEENFIQWARARENVEELIWPERKKLTPEEKRAKVRQILGIAPRPA